MKLYKRVKIAEHYLAYLINDDPSALTDAEIDQCDIWVRLLPDYVTFDVRHDLSSSFMRCDICDMLATCYEVDLYVPESYDDA